MWQKKRGATINPYAYTQATSTDTHTFREYFLDISECIKLVRRSSEADLGALAQESNSAADPWSAGVVLIVPRQSRAVVQM